MDSLQVFSPGAQLERPDLKLGRQRDPTRIVPWVSPRLQVPIGTEVAYEWDDPNHPGHFKHRL